MSAWRLRPLRARLTPGQKATRRDKLARRADEREAARLLERARSRRRKAK